MVGTILPPETRMSLLKTENADHIDDNVEYVKISYFFPDPDDVCRNDRTTPLGLDSTFSYMDIPGCVPWGEPAYFHHSADVRQYRIVEGTRKQTVFNRRQNYGWSKDPTDNPKRDQQGERIPSVPIWSNNLRRVSLNKLLFPLANFCELVSMFVIYMEVGGVFGWRTTMVWFPNERAKARAAESEDFARDLKRTQGLRQRLIEETRQQRSQIVYRIRGWKNLHTLEGKGMTGRTAIDLVADEPCRIVDAQGKPVMMGIANKAFDMSKPTKVPMKPSQALTLENYRLSLVAL